MKLLVQTVDKTTFDVEVQEDGTLQDLRNQISAVKNHPSDQMKLIYNGSILDNNAKKLSEYKLVEGTKLVILFQKAKVEQKQPAKQTEPKAPEEKPVEKPGEQPTGSEQEAQPGNMAGQFANMAQQNPEAFMQMLANDPFLGQIIQQNPQFMMQFIGDPNFLNNLIQAEPTEEDAMYEKFFDGEIQLNDAQKKEVQEIMTMSGCPFAEVIQYYEAYDHNKEMTLNALFNEKFGD